MYKVFVLDNSKHLKIFKWKDWPFNGPMGKKQKDSKID